MKNLKICIVCCIITVCLLGRAQSDLNVIPFQGQLANQSGQVLNPSNAVTVVFRLYTAPVGGMAMWEESQPNVSVNNGRFSVLLGSRTMLPDPKNFNATLYLGITVDDSNPATVDVEMRPRQAIVPVISARFAQNADKLNGYDWSALFGTNNPTGTISGARIANGSITAAQIANSTITASQIASNTLTANQFAGAIITSNQIVNGSISSLDFAPGSVLTATIANGAVGISNLAPRNFSGSTASAGNFAISASSGTFTTRATAFVDVTNLSVTITTTGRPVFVGLLPAPGATDANIHVSPDGQTGAFGYFAFISGVDRLPTPVVYTSVNYWYGPPSSLFSIHLPQGPGLHTYKLQMKTVQEPVNSYLGSASVVDCVLVAYEL